MRYTLIADGSSDAVLLPILTWCLRRHGITPIEAQEVDLSRLPRRSTIGERIASIIDLYPCDVLFVHRDAEGQSPQSRRVEIAAALDGTKIAHIPVVPVRMTEAWLLIDESAIRFAAGNPNGTAKLNLPDSKKLEDLPDPKKVLHDAIVAASELNARRRSSLPVHKRVRRVSNYSSDFSKLEALAAFQRLQKDIETFVRSHCG